MFVPTLLSVVLWAAVSAAGPDDLLADPEARALVAEAQVLFAEGNFADAAKKIEKAYLIEPVPELLFPWAQAQREQGNCRAAIALYNRMLEDIPDGPMATSARQNIARCEEEMPAEAAEEEQIIPIEEDPPDEAVEAAPVAAPTERDDEPKAKVWFKDPVGGVLSGLGVAGVGAGAALLIVASSTAKNAPDAPSLADYTEQGDRAVTLRNAGAGVLSVGGALLVAGIIRYTLVAKKNKASATASVWTAPGGGGLTFSGRF